jgi:hypothetical protein
MQIIYILILIVGPSTTTLLIFFLLVRHYSKKTETNKTMKEHILSRQIIEELKEAGFTYDQMLDVLRIAKEKYRYLAKNKEHKDK